MENVTVFVEVCREDVVLPEYKNLWDAGMDICSAENILIKPGETKLIPTGLKLAIPEGYEIQVRPRSGLSLNTPLRVTNSPGTIDTGYRDEVCVILTNSSLADDESNTLFELTSKGNLSGTYSIKKGDRIAQIVLSKVPRIQFEIVQSVKEIGENRGGGFGSTGV